MLAVSDVEVDGRRTEDVTCVLEGELHVGRDVRRFAPVHVNDVEHALSDVFHAVGSTLSFSAADLQEIRLKQEHHVAGRRCAVHRTSVSVLEQDRKHAGVVQVRVGQHHGIQFVQRQGFWGREVRHGVGVAGNVDADVDHHTRFVGRDQMASTAHFAVGTECGDAGPSRTGACGAVDIKAEVLEQLASLGGVGLAVTADVVNGLGQHRRGAFDADEPSGRVTDFVEHRTTAANGLTGVVADQRDFTKACVEVDVLQAR